MAHNGNASGFAALLDELQVPRDRLLYVQSSVDWMQRAGIDASDALATLTEWIAPGGTLVMPSYPFAGTHREYLESEPVFDVRYTPVAIGLLPEVFRRSKGVIRSLDPDFCVAALGADAEAVAAGGGTQADPFGPSSSYERMLDRHAIHVGLGVSLNTSSFIHVIDSRAESGYPAPVYENRAFPVTVVDYKGESRRGTRKALRPPFQQLTAPSAVADAMRPGPQIFSSFERNGARFFRWDLDVWASWCLTHAKRQAAARAWPCWLARLAAQADIWQAG